MAPCFHALVSHMPVAANWSSLDWILKACSEERDGITCLDNVARVTFVECIDLKLNV